MVRTLADLELAALDVVALAPAGEDVGLGRLGAVIASWAEGERTGRARQPTSSWSSTRPQATRRCDDLAVTARALRALLDDARDLDARDLAPPGATDAVSGIDTDELAGRVDDVRAALARADSALGAAMTAGDDLRRPLLACSGFALPGTVAAEPIAGDRTRSRPRRCGPPSPVASWRSTRGSLRRPTAGQGATTSGVIAPCATASACSSASGSPWPRTSSPPTAPGSTRPSRASG